MAAATGKKSNKEIVSEVMNGVFVKRKPETVLHYFSESYIQHNPLIPNGREAIPGLVAGPPQDFLYQPGMLAEDGDIVMIHGRYIGWGPKAMVAVDIFRLADGKLAEQKRAPTRSGRAVSISLSN